MNENYEFASKLELLKKKDYEKFLKIKELVEIELKQNKLEKNELKKRCNE